jgi:hypothetical protein
MTIETLDLATGDNSVPPIGDQRTSAFPYEQLFSGYDNGLVFVYDQPNVTAFKDMLSSDGTSSSIEKLLTFPILACPWEISPSKGDKGEAEFVSEMFAATEFNEGMKTPMETVIAQLTWAMTVRRVYFEKVFKIRESDNKVVYDKLAWCPPETCELALDPKTGEHKGFRQQPVYFGPPASRRLPGKEGWIYVKPERAFVYVHGMWRDPIDGFSSMQVPYWVWQTKRKIRYLWYQFLETTSLPKTLVRNNDEARARDDARKVATLRSRDVLGLSTDTEVEAFESSGRGAAQFIEALRWLDGEAMKSILAGFMELSSSAAAGKGSYALSHDLSSLFLRTRRVVARDMARQITTQVIGDIVRYNFGPKASCPTFTFGPISEANEETVVELFSNITQVSQAQQLPKEFLDQLTVRVANLLELDNNKVQESINAIKEVSPNHLTEMVNTVDMMTQLVQEGTGGDKGATNGSASKSSSSGGKSKTNKGVDS